MNVSGVDLKKTVNLPVSEPKTLAGWTLILSFALLASLLLVVAIMACRLPARRAGHRSRCSPFAGSEENGTAREGCL